MARYLFTVWSFSGHINPNLAVANALRERGHEVAFYTGARAASTLSRLGMRHFPLQHVDVEALYRLLFPPDDRAGRASTLREVRRARTTFRQWLVDTVPQQLSGLQPVLDGWSPDAIVCDPTMWAPFLIIREVRSLPVAIFSYTTGCMLSGPGAPPWGRGLPPPTTPFRRARAAIERRIAARVNRDFHVAANRFRAAWGLKPIAATVTDFAGTMPLYLVTSVPEFDYCRTDLPRNVHYIGRCQWDRPADAPPPSWVEELARDRPLVYVTEGTVQGSQPALLQASARGLAHRPLHVLLTLNADRDPAALGLSGLAPNVQLQTYAPGQGWQSDVLTRADVVVTNGGAGSVMAALAAGLPVVVVPTAWDKPENAMRVVAAGAGIRVPPNHATPERIRAAVEEVLEAESFRRSAQRISRALAAAGGPALAAALLEQMVTGQDAGVALKRDSREDALMY